MRWTQNTREKMRFATRLVCVKEIKFEKARQIFITAAFLATILIVNIFVIFDVFSGYLQTAEFSFPTPSLIGLFMFLLGGNAIAFAVFNLLFGNRFSIQKAMQKWSLLCCLNMAWFRIYRLQGFDKRYFCRFGYRKRYWAWIQNAFPHNRFA